MKRVLLPLKRHSHGKGRGRNAVSAAAALFLALSLFSCATAPKEAPALKALGLLPGNALVTGKIEAADNLELIDEVLGRTVLGNEELQRILGRTETLFFSMDETGSGKTVLYGVLIGDFPKNFTTSVIAAEEGWEKQWGKTPYWEHRVTGAQIAVPQGRIVLFSTGDIERLIGNYRNGAAPDMVYEAAREFGISDLVLYITAPSRFLLSGFPLDPEQFPMKKLWFSLLRIKDDYYLDGVFILDTEENAQRMALLSRILIVGWIKQHGLADLKEIKNTLTIETERTYVRLSGIRMNLGGAASFIDILIPDGMAAQ